MLVRIGTTCSTTEHAEGWTLDRMPAVDRAILRIAVYELVYSADVPPPSP